MDEKDFDHTLKGSYLNPIYYLVYKEQFYLRDNCIESSYSYFPFKRVCSALGVEHIEIILTFNL